MAHARQIEPLNDRHERGEFSCGKASLDAFLKTQGGPYSRRGVGRTYVAVGEGETRVIGYYTLAASSIPFEEVPPRLQKKLPRHPVPTILLGRLAVDRTAHGQGLGKELLMDALHRALQIADQLGVVAVHVHAIDDEAKTFYSHYGFQSLPDRDRHMIMTMEAIREGFGE